jgi:hypothetical protein
MLKCLKLSKSSKPNPITPSEVISKILFVISQIGLFLIIVNRSLKLINPENETKQTKILDLETRFDFIRFQDFGEVTGIFEDEGMCINQEFIFLKKKFNGKSYSLKLENLTPTKICRYYLVRDDKSKTVFKGTPVISLNPKYIELKFQFIKMLLQRGLSEMTLFTQTERKVRNRLIQAIIDQIEEIPLFNKTSIRKQGKPVSESEEIKAVLKTRLSVAQKIDTRVNSPQNQPKRQIGGNSEFKITVTQNDLNGFTESKKNIESSFDSSDLSLNQSSTQVKFIEDLLPIFIHKNEFGSRPNAQKNPEETSFMGPMGTGMPFNNFTNKTYLFGIHFFWLISSRRKS